MLPSNHKMHNHRVSIFIILAFILGFITLFLLRIYSVANMNELLKGNEKLFNELRAENQLRTVDRNLMGVESRIRAAIATHDTSHLSGIDVKTTELRNCLDSLKKGNNDRKDLDRLSVLANEKLVTAHQLKAFFIKTGQLNDTSFIANPRARMISDEITGITNNIYDRRQKLMSNLSEKIKENGRIAGVVGNVFIVLVFICSCLLCWFIIKQLRKLNLLILKLDISERKALEALQIKENFLANMSHEIRTPLNSILGFTNLMKKQELNPVSKEYLNSIQGAGENLLAIINDILDLSKIEAGMMRIVNNPFSVRGLIHSIESLFNEKIREKGLLFNYKIDNDVPDTLLGDATRLTQILVNLIGNAIKFSGHGEISVKFYNKVTIEKDIQLGIIVTDQGIGIEKEKLTAIFDRFNQAEEFITRNYGGTGLGLSIVKNLVILQQGNIEVKSEPGKGTEFHFHIPYTIAGEQIPNLTLQHADQFKDHINSSVNILVVDDNSMNQSLMKHLLLQWDVSFDIVSNGLEAISMLKLKKYDLILMDIQMPKMNGYMATDHIRNELKLAVPIVAMTAHAMAGEREKCIGHGMNEYIAKPIAEDNLFEMIGKFIDRKVDQGNISPLPQIADYKFIDLAYMKTISRGSITYERTVTAQFIECIPKDLYNVQEAYEQKKYAELNKIAHNMKTSVAIMGLLPAFGVILDTLEFVQDDSGILSSTINKLQVICEQSMEEAIHFYTTITDR